MALNEQRDNPDILVKEYKSSIEFTVEAQSLDLPYLTSSFFAQLKQQENLIIIESLSGEQVDDLSNIPKEKKAFDETFRTEVRKKTNKNVVIVHFVIRSQRTWSNIWYESFEYLQQNRIWLRKTPGPVTNSKMVALGHITNIPREASISCITTEIKLRMIKNKNKSETASDDARNHGYDLKTGLNIYLD